MWDELNIGLRLGRATTEQPHRQRQARRSRRRCGKRRWIRREAHRRRDGGSVRTVRANCARAHENVQPARETISETGTCEDIKATVRQEGAACRTCMSWLRLGWPDILRCLGVQVGAANTPAEHAEAEAESTRMEAIRTDESPRPSSWCLLARHQTIVGKCKYLRFTARWPNSRSGRRTSACRAQPPPPGPASWWAPPGSAETTWAPNSSTL